MRLRPLSVPLALLCVPVLLLSACGSSGGGSSDEDQVTAVVQTSATSNDPADCQKLSTQKFMAQSTFATGKAAVQTCEQDARSHDNTPNSVKVADVKVGGDSATASVAFKGGTFDGQTVDLALVKDGDQWKVDEITDIPNFDVAKFAAAFETGTQQGPNPATPKQAKCVGDQIRGADPAKLKAVILGGDATPFVNLFQLCTSAG